MTLITLPLSASQIYLVPCEGGYLQIDAGYEWDYDLYLQGLADAKIDPAAVRYLLLTHHHDDHAGFLAYLLKVRDSITVIAHEKASELLCTGANDQSRGGGYVNRLVWFLANLKMRLDPRWTLTFPPCRLRASDILLDTDNDHVLRRIGIAGRVLYTPGHCIDHIAVVLDDGVTFCGDAAASMLLWAGTRYCTVFMTDMEQAYASWEKMLAAGSRTIYPAHGRPFDAAKLRHNLRRIKTSGLVW